MKYETKIQLKLGTVVVFLVMFFTILWTCSCSAPQNLHQPEFHQSTIIDIDTTNGWILRKWEFIYVEKYDIKLENYRGVVFYQRATELDSLTREVGGRIY